jgi:hypothetical protein
MISSIIRSTSRCGRSHGYCCERRTLGCIAKYSFRFGISLIRKFYFDFFKIVAKWLPQLEKKLEQCWETGHESFRMFMSAEPSADPAFHCIPQGILESAVKM